ncbi:hypothetical protein CF67_04055 [Candidatus Photodesmus blepharus]|uniref:Polymer-forming cytoskeletal protein n=1 Tax=Candidatus Photodesmus blepharonis TaxID=1179155 RepID=A0A084CN34_9GAMM|nr:polymer-forming cytoskeletal protein [Candidatus Photodesmus blepharus]KEY91213.1 hypothetical protein CF67_04055 [Candidatus Photodesmus blepharus]
MQVDGTVEGQVHVDKTLIISEAGFVNGEIFAERVIVNGSFEGTCRATRIEILNQGSVHGTIYSDNLSIEPGGKFNGVTDSNSEQKESGGVSKALYNDNLIGGQFDDVTDSNKQQIVELTDAKKKLS